MARFYDRYEAVMAAINQGIVPSEKDMKVINDDGQVIAIEAAYRFTFPVDWNFWEVRDEDGWTAAHSAAEAMRLPHGFEKWNLTDERGVTVAEVYATAIMRKGVMSDEFQSGVSTIRKVDQAILEQENQDGNSARKVLEKANRIAEQQFENRMEKLRAILNRPNIHPKKI